MGSECVKSKVAICYLMITDREREKMNLDTLPLNKPNELNLKAKGEDKGSLQRENNIK